MLANALGGRAGAGGGRGGGVEGGVNAQRMRALEGQVLQAKMESNESKEDAAKVSHKITNSGTKIGRKGTGATPLSTTTIALIRTMRTHPATSSNAANKEQRAPPAGYAKFQPILLPYMDRCTRCWSCSRPNT